MTTYDAKIVLDSIGPNGARLTTFEITSPRFIHSEWLTHRTLSRNSASSRAIPTQKLIDRVVHFPATPVFWGRNQAGMQASAELEGEALEHAQGLWNIARNNAVVTALALNELGLHKQIANRVIEPWMFITVLASATEWSNLFALRRDKAAQPEFRHVAEMAWAAYSASEPQKLQNNQWHLPLVTGRDESQLRETGYSDKELCAISVGRCAAVSYLNHDGLRDPSADIDRASRLAKNGHMSPFEHVARALTRDEWELYAIEAMTAWVNERVPPGNLWGWEQFRKTLANEHDFSLLNGDDP